MKPVLWRTEQTRHKRSHQQRSKALSGGDLGREEHGPGLGQGWLGLRDQDRPVRGPWGSPRQKPVRKTHLDPSNRGKGFLSKARGRLVRSLPKNVACSSIYQCG